MPANIGPEASRFPGAASLADGVTSGMTRTTASRSRLERSELISGRKNRPRRLAPHGEWNVMAHRMLV